MRIRTTVAGIAAAVIVLAGCSSSGSSSDKTPKDLAATPAAAKARTADQVAAELVKAIPSMKVTVVYTEDTDGDHQLGRPGGYTSKVAFTDSRIPESELKIEGKDSIARGGGIEVFDTTSAAQARADYIQKVTASLPALREYDYVSGTAVIRVSRILPPSKAREYEAAAKRLN